MTDEFRPEDRAFIARAKQALDQTVEEMDPATALRLQRARLATMQSHVSRRCWPVWVSGVAMVSIAMMVLILWMKEPVPENAAPVLLEDFELVTSGENVELAEDLDFYYWLADGDSTG